MRRVTSNKKGYYRSQSHHDRYSQQAHKRSRDRVRNSLNGKYLPKSWDEFKEYSLEDQWEIALTLLVMVALFKEFERTDFVQGIFQEYEWELADSWEYCCETCDLPYSFCKS